jgi:hypothetical protein
MSTDTQAAPSWDYKGTEITFNVERATFYASIGKRRFSAPSLDAMKRKLDEQREFAGFTGYIEVDAYYAKREIERGAVEVARTKRARGTDREALLLRVEIVGFDRKEREYRMADGSAPDRSAIYVTDDEAGFIATWKEFHEAEYRKAERVAQLDAEINEIRAKFKTRSPREEL